MPFIRKEVDFIRMSRLIKGYASNGAQLAKVLDVSGPTGKRRLDNPEELTLADLKKISQRLHIPVDDLRAAIQW